MNNYGIFKIGIKTVIFLSILFFAVHSCSRVLMHFEKYNTDIVRQFDRYKNTPLDVIILGNSAVRNGIDSARLLEKYGIYSYTMGTGHQPVMGSLYFLKEVMKHQKPGLVVLDVGSLPKTLDSRVIHYITDVAPLDWNKIRLVYSAGRDLLDQNGTSDFKNVLGVMFPIIQYHGNWKNLSKKSFVRKPEMIFRGFPVEYFTSQKYNLEDFTFEDAGELSEELTGEPSEEFTGEPSEELTEEPADESSQINPYQKKYFQEILKTCKDNDIAILLIKTPKMKWTEEESVMVYDCIKEYKEITFLDFNEILLFDECGFDMDYDFWDFRHLNYSGAVKLTDYLGKYMIDHYHIQPHELNNEDDMFLRKYNAAVKSGLLSVADQTSDILDLISQPEFEVLIQMNGDYSELADSEFADWLVERNGNDRSLFSKNNFLMVLNDGSVVYKDSSDEDIDYIGSFRDNIEYKIYSNIEREATPVVRIDGDRIKFSGHGINILVYDKENSCVADMFTVSCEDGSVTLNR